MFSRCCERKMIVTPQELESKINQFITATHTNDRIFAQNLIDHFGGNVDMAIEAQLNGNLPEIHRHDVMRPQAAGIDTTADVPARTNIFTSIIRQISHVLTGEQENLTAEVGYN